MVVVHRDSIFEHTHIYPYVRYCNEDRHEGGWVLEKRTISGYEFIYITEGKGIIFIEDRQYEMVPGRMILIPSDTEHEAWAESDPFCFLCAHFEVFAIPSNLTAGTLECPSAFERCLVDFDECVTVADPGHIRHIFRRIISEAYTMSRSSELMVRTLFTELLATLFRETAGESTPLKLSEEMIAAIRYIRERCHTHLRLCDIAEHIHLQPTYVSALFKKQTGHSVTEYINMNRIFKAKGLLLNTSETVEVISQKVGFYDARHFSKVFKKQEGMTPAQFRRMG